MNRSPSSVSAADHFQDLETQHRASQLGMWVFLGSETLLFSALFVLYTAFAVQQPDVFQAGVHHNNRVLGSIMTITLIVSSFFVAWAVHAAEEGARRSCLATLGVVWVLGVAFLCMKGYEYADHFHHGIRPGQYYAFDELPTAGGRMFFTLYYAMTALHALHVIAGLIVLATIGTGIMRSKLDVARAHHLKLGALYWHLVDIVWIFLWPLLYLS